MIRATALLAAAALAPAVAPAVARADPLQSVFGVDTVSGFLDVRAAAADGQPSWLRGGYGKTQASGAGADFAARANVDLAALAWRPDFGDGFGAYVLAQSQPGQDHAVDLAEAYLTYKPAPAGAIRVSARVGLMWPPASLEHDGTAWTTTRTLTPSAINTWIAEEVRVIGAEATVAADTPAGRLSATGAVFGSNDTSGTLLAFRGWVLDDIRTTAFGSLPLPRFTAGQMALHAQDDEARPSLELDGDPGGYVKLEWRPPAPVALELFGYDNGGDPNILKYGQWGWRTRFVDAGLTWKPGANVEVLAQGLSGDTYFGPLTAFGHYVDVEFTSAYLLATRTEGRHRVTARADWFKSRDRSFQAFDNEDEEGWAATADYAYALTSHLGLWVEASHVRSQRPSAAVAGFKPEQDQTVLQVALRAKL